MIELLESSSSSSSSDDSGNEEDEVAQVLQGVWPDDSIYVGGSETMSTLIPEKEKGENEIIKEEKENKDNKNKETPSKDTKSVRRPKAKKDKNDPFRFQGDGVAFKAKLIGIQEVKDARGDEMCQEALQFLKAHIKTSGDHKLKISINVSLDGLRIIDDKTGEIQHHHPVHKISFIARDVTDNRAFGYIYGTPTGGHKFFGIKTEKAAEHLVMTMRDLFQVVYEVKKTEMEACQKLQAEQLEEDLYKVPPESVSRPTNPKIEGDYDVPNNKPIPQNEIVSSISLANLQNELHNIQQGIDQMDDQLSDEAFFNLILDSSDKKLTPDSSGSDPFLPVVGQVNPFNLSSKSIPAGNVSITKDLFADDPFGTSFIPATSPPRDPFVVLSSTPTPSMVIAPDKYAAFTDFSETSLFTSDSSSVSSSSSSTFTGSSSMFNDAFSSSKATVDLLPPQPPVPPARSVSPQPKDPFADLCDLGKDRPPQDKKEFFAELKAPPKKITLNDLKKGIQSDEGSSSPDAPCEGNILDFSFPSPQVPPPPLPTSIDIEETAPPPPPRPLQANPIPKPRRNDLLSRQSPPAENFGVSNHLNFPILPPPPLPNGKLENHRTKELNIFSKKEDPFADDDFFMSLSSRNNSGPW